MQLTRQNQPTVSRHNCVLVDRVCPVQHPCSSLTDPAKRSLISVQLVQINSNEGLRLLEQLQRQPQKLPTSQFIGDIRFKDSIQKWTNPNQARLPWAPCCEGAHPLVEADRGHEYKYALSQPPPACLTYYQFHLVVLSVVIL